MNGKASGESIQNVGVRQEMLSMIAVKDTCQGKQLSLKSTGPNFFMYFSLEESENTSDSRLWS